MKITRKLKVALLHTKYQVMQKIAFNENVLLFYDIRNWGDQINKELSKKAGMDVALVDIDVRNKFLRGNQSYKASKEILMIGSVAHHCSSISEIYGSGIIDPSIKLSCKPRTIRAVRGPLTRKYFLMHGVPCPEVYGDPALLMPRYFDFKPTKKHSVGIIMHNDHRRGFSVKNSEVRMINLRWGFDRVLEEILSCDNIISSSLHGLIVSDAYGIPNLRLITDTSLYGGDFKFNDYYLSLGLENHDYAHVSELQDMKEIIKRCVAKDIAVDLNTLDEVCPRC